MYILGLWFRPGDTFSDREISGELQPFRRHCKIVAEIDTFNNPVATFCVRSGREPLVQTLSLFAPMGSISPALIAPVVILRFWVGGFTFYARWKWPRAAQTPHTPTSFIFPKPFAPRHLQTYRETDPPLWRRAPNHRPSAERAPHVSLRISQATRPMSLLLS